MKSFKTIVTEKQSQQLIQVQICFQYAENMTTKEYADRIRKKIDDSFTHSNDYYEPISDIPSNKGTTHLSVVGPDGSAVSMTSSINLE